MTNAKARILLDYIPLLIIIVWTINLLWTISTTNIILSHEHYIGLSMLFITAAMFFKKHQLGIISLGLLLIIGLIGFISFSPSIVRRSIGFSISDFASPEIKFQPIFLLWLIIHFIISGRYYVGILTKKYWQDLFKNTAARAIEDLKPQEFELSETQKKVEIDKELDLIDQNPGYLLKWEDVRQRFIKP